MAAEKFDKYFGGWVYRQLLPLFARIDVKKWSHALSYTGGVDINDKEAYEKKLGWMLSGSPVMTSAMRHKMYLVAEHLGVLVEYKGDPPKLTKPRTFKALGINIVHHLRGKYALLE